MDYGVYLNRGYLAKFLALHESMEQHCQPYHLWTMTLDEATLQALQELNLPNTQLVPFEEVETDALRQVKPFRTPKEYIWTSKATWILWLLEKQKVQRLMYLDVDMLFFGGPEPVFEEIGSQQIALTPHRFPPRLQHLVVNGLFNVGVVYVTLGAVECIRRWAIQCIDWCYHRHEHGQFAEQRYLDEWPALWNAYSIQHKGFNLAPWNQEQYAYSKQDRQLYVDGDPLVLYHFHHGLKPGYPLVSLVKAHIYRPYRLALADAERTMCS